MPDDRRLIEDFLPIEAIGKEASREKSIRKGHISTLHLWWARRPLVACRAAVYGALVPASRFIPENGPDNKKQSLGRANAARFLERLCKYPGDPAVIKEAQRHILEAHAERLSRETGKTVTVEDIEAGRAPRPKVLDMFAGGGSIPLEALRLGCDAYAMDLNPVAYIILLCTLVYPQKYGKPDPNARGMTGPKNSKGETTWGGLASEVRYWGEWVLKKVKAEIGDLYPLIPDPAYKGRRPETQGTLWPTAKDDEVPPGYLVPVAYLWTRTVRCKNPACGATVPLVRQTWLCKKQGRYVALKMIAPKGAKQVRFEVVESATENGLGFDPAAFSKGGNATCPFCGTVADGDYVKAEGCAKRMGRQMMAIVCTRPGKQGKIYLSADDYPQFQSDENAIRKRIESLCQNVGLTVPSESISSTRPSPNARGLSALTRYGFSNFGELFTTRQLLAHLTSSACIKNLWKQLCGDERSTAVVTTLSLVASRAIDWNSTNCRWFPQGESNLNTYGRQALPMLWDFCETNAVIRKPGSFSTLLDGLVEALPNIGNIARSADVFRGTATRLVEPALSYDAVITDPPYYDNVPYADISDFFYVWLRRMLVEQYSEHFSSDTTPKKHEVTALASRYGGDMARATADYESMMLRSLEQAHRILKPQSPLVMVYAHKTALGWSTLVDAIRKAGFTVSEAWPVDTEVGTRLVATDASALASSIFLVARKREGNETGSYEEDVRPELEQIVRERVDSLWKMGITGADLVIAAVGAGLRAFTRCARVEYANGEEVPAEKFLAEVEGVVLETLLEKIFRVAGAGVSAVDGATRFYVLWRYTYGAAEMDAGEAIVFTYGQNVELDGPNGLSTGSRPLVEKKKGKYRLRDFTERGGDEKLGQPRDDGKPTPLIDALHRILWLIENEPRKLNRFLDEARPDRERLRLVAQTLAGTALEGGGGDGKGAGVSTTAAEAAALKKLVANWRALVEQPELPLFRQTGG